MKGLEKVLNYVPFDVYSKEKNVLKNGEDKVIYDKEKVKIKIMKRGNKIYNIITNYGDIDIRDIAKELVVQA